MSAHNHTCTSFDHESSIHNLIFSPNTLHLVLKQSHYWISNYTSNKMLLILICVFLCIHVCSDHHYFISFFNREKKTTITWVQNLSLVIHVVIIIYMYSKCRASFEILGFQAVRLGLDTWFHPPENSNLHIPGVQSYT